MKFYPPKIIRFYYRYLMLLLLIGLPIILAIGSFHIKWTKPNDQYFGFTIGIFLAVVGALLINVGFWEKFFAVLRISDTTILWKCPFRKTRILPISDCVEIGAYLENKNNGIPSEQIYFSKYPYPQKNMDKHGIMKPSQDLIKFWYSDELYRFLIGNMSSKQTSCLRAYKWQRKK